MSVGTFDPLNAAAALTSDAIAELLAVAPSAEGQVDLDLSTSDIARLAPYATHSDWPGPAADLADDDIVCLIRLFTLAEGQYAGWAAGAKSPVIALVRLLKTRDRFDAGLNRWIKTHTDNKFLPHGSLLDRL